MISNWQMVDRSEGLYERVEIEGGIEGFDGPVFVVLRRGWAGWW